MNCDDASLLFAAHRANRLDAERATELAAHLEGCASCRHEADADAELDAALARLPPRRAPDRLKRSLEARWLPGRRASALRPLARALFAAALGAAVALAVAFLILGRAPSDAMLNEAVNDHLRLLYAERPLEVASGGVHQVKPWFAGRLDFAPVVAFGGDADFPLEGGAVALFLDRKAAAFSFKRRLHPITLFVFRADGLPWPPSNRALGPVRATLASSRGFHTLLFRRGDLGYALVSDVAEPDLVALGEKIARD